MPPPALFVGPVVAGPAANLAVHLARALAAVALSSRRRRQRPLTPPLVATLGAALAKQRIADRGPLCANRASNRSPTAGRSTRGRGGVSLVGERNS